MVEIKKIVIPVIEQFVNKRFKRDLEERRNEKD